MALLLAALEQKAPPSGGDCFAWYNILPFAVIGLIMYLLMIRPRQTEAKKMKAALDNLKKNDKVLTRAGIIAVVDRVHETEIVLKIDEKKDVRMRVAKGAIEHIFTPGSEPASKELPETSEEKKS